MPNIPDVGILHCGELPHHKMGIKVIKIKNYFLKFWKKLQLNTYKNIEGGTVGRILSYYDLCDVKYNTNIDKDMDFSEFMTEEEIEEAALKKEEREEEERLEKEEEEHYRKEEERREQEAEEEKLRAERLKSIKVISYK